MKNILTAVLIMVTAMQATAQETTTIFINKIKSASCTVTEGQTAASIVLNKKQVKNAKEIMVQVQSSWVTNEVYKKEIEVETAQSIVLQEVKGKPGFFNITKAKAALQKGKNINLYLLLNPANSKMLIPSRRIYLGTFAVK